MNDSATTVLQALANDVERLLAERLQPLDLTVPQLRFLADFAANPDHSAADASKASHVSPQTGTTIVQNLITKRLITARHVPGNGRRNEITVTVDGKHVLDQALAAVADVEKRLKALLGTEAVSRLDGAISALEPYLPSRAWRPSPRVGAPLPQRSRIND